MNIPKLVERKKLIQYSPEQAPPGIPLWQINQRVKEAVFTFHGKPRAITHSQCKPFSSLEEFQAFAEFIEGHSDFILVCGKVQDVVDPTSIAALPDGRIVYATKGLTTPEPFKVVFSLNRSPTYLWTVPLPWEPIPPEYRWWLNDPLYENEVERYYREVPAKLSYLKGTLPKNLSAQSADSPRYWTGGHNWSTGSRLNEFLAENAWWHGFSEDDLHPKAVDVREEFARIKVGDYFAIKGYSGQNDLKIHYVGRVNQIDEATQRLILTPMSLPKPTSINPSSGTGSWFGTLREVTDQALIAWMFEQEPYMTTSPISSPVVEPSPLNVILYGPPGTGKTYNTIQRAVKIIDGSISGTMDETKKRWDQLRSEGRIEFVTFHQSYGYEDFVEGIRPVMDDETGAMPHYEVFEGILKRIAIKALGAGLFMPPKTVEARIRFDDIWESFLEEIQNNPERTYESDTGRKQLSFAITSVGTITIKPSRSRARKREDFEILFLKHHQDQLSPTDVKEIKQEFGTYYTAILRELKRIEREMAPQVQTPSDVSDFSSAEEQGRHYLRFRGDNVYQLRPTSDRPRYVLVIDEINRGNISKVFGELITLIEDDKRIGADLAMTVTLPFSRETFGLPSNLYILGTMNTADKSIALVDVALRRRFEFEELMPDFTTCEGLSPTMQAVLSQLNQRIVLRKDRDHQIGHAFFIRVSDVAGFNRVFEKKVIPLLQEYFYGDWDALRFVLGEPDGKHRFIRPIEGAEVKGARNRWQWYRDDRKFTGTLNILDSLAKNYSISPDVEATDGE